MTPDEEDDDEYYTIPIPNQRIFGAGIKRQRIAFVRGASLPATTSNANTPSTNTGPTLAERYLQEYKEREKEKEKAQSVPATPNDSPSAEYVEPGEPQSTSQEICEVCKTPIRTGPSTLPHETTITHQLALQHSHGPSAINRTSRGLPYMESRGWNPDDRKGLGATGEGILYPIEVQEKKNRFGLGVRFKAKVKGGDEVVEGRVKKVTNLTARQIRKMDDEERRRGERLREVFYRDEKVERMLGTLEEGTAPAAEKRGGGEKGVNGFEEFAKGRR